MSSCPPHPLSDSPLAFLPPAGHTHAPTAEEAGMLRKACQGFINVITVLMASTSIHHFLFISIVVSVNVQLGTSRHVPSSKPEKPCWFPMSLAFVFSSREGLRRVHAHSHHNHVACQWYSCKLEGCLLNSSSGTVWGSFVFVFLFYFKDIYPQLLLRKVKISSTFSAQKPPAALQKQNSFFICFSNKVLCKKTSFLLFFWCKVLMPTVRLIQYELHIAMATCNAAHSRLHSDIRNIHVCYGDNAFVEER